MSSTVLSKDPREYVGGFHYSQLTEAVCIRLVQGCGKLVVRIPKHLRTNAVLIAAVKSAPKVIKDIDPSEITKEMYAEAVSKDPSVVKYIPGVCRTWEHNLELWKSGNMTLSGLLASTPIDHMDDIYTAIVEKQLWYLPNVPEQYRTREMCFKYIKGRYPGASKYIPHQFLDQEMYELLAGGHIDFYDIPEKFRNLKVKMEFVALNSKYITYLEPLTKELIVQAYKRNNGVFKSVPKKYMDASLYKLAFAETKKILEIPTEYWTEDMIITTLKGSWRDWERTKLTLKDIPEHLRTDLVKLLVDKEEH